ncbi:chromosomal replication initiator protein DnaA [Candidatus Proelusimicrobium excrementi]|uniref:chromosomal replication initiator protein DnaA n=1 Tax=Candidatus Proelusimicrobium excrementi TaxID=3416222 RepID=UPI003CBFB603|nr:chromosomal replication initiator protein DnaA [Elusimicrobiaceae bacterium]
MENLNINEIWADFFKKLENNLGKDICEMWIKPMKITSFKGGILKIELPSEVWLKTIKDRYESSIIQALTEILNTTFSIEYNIPSKEEIPKQDYVSLPENSVYQQKNPFINKLNSYFTFEGFIEGPSNRFAYKASEAVVKKMGERTNNPFVIFSSPGLGKTHLLHAIGNQLLKENPFAKVLYMSGEGFVSEYIESLQKSTQDSFRKKYRSLDCLLIDDIQFVVGKERCEEEFFYTFNSLFDNRKQIVLTSDRTPNQLGLSERLSSRLLSGIVAEIKRPDLETRIAILRQKRDSNNFDITDDVLAFIAEGVQGSIRELEGCLFRLTTYCNIHGVNATISIAKEVLADILTLEKEKCSISINQIKKVVCKYFKVSIEDLNSKKKNNSIAWPRQVSMYLATELTLLSLPEIGREFNRDHSTVIHAKEKVKEEIDNNLLFAPIINDLINKVKAVDNN